LQLKKPIRINPHCPKLLDRTWGILLQTGAKRLWIPAQHVHKLVVVVVKFAPLFGPWQRNYRCMQNKVIKSKAGHPAMNSSKVPLLLG
jgi:hypothetical protein